MIKIKDWSVYIIKMIFSFIFICIPLIGIMFLGLMNGAEMFPRKPN